MFFMKNLPLWERIARLVLTIALIGAGVNFWGTILGYGLLSTAIVTALTGIVGFCPMCAMVGRKPVGTGA